MSQKKFVTNLALLLFLNLLIKPFWILGIDREVQNLVGEKEYGLYFALFNLSLVVWLAWFALLVVWLFGCLVVWLSGCLVVWFAVFACLTWYRDWETDRKSVV